METLHLLFEENIVKGTHTLYDIQETVNSFYTFDMVLDTIDEKLIKIEYPVLNLIQLILRK